MESVQSCLDILKRQLQNYLEEILMKIYGEDYILYMEHGTKGVNQIIMNDYNVLNKNKYKDVLFYLNAFIKNWELLSSLFTTNYAVSLCHTIKYFRNKWAHQSPFSLRETYRFMDECQALIEEIKKDSSEIDIIRKQLLEIYYASEVNNYYNSINNNNNFQQNDNLINFSTENKSNLLSNSNNNFVSYNNISNRYINDNNIMDYNHDMIDGSQIDREQLIDLNYQKLINNNKDFKITNLSDLNEK